MPRANIYVDGFNLYFGAVRGTPYKWLNLRLLSKALLHGDVEIGRIRYFTARVNDRANSSGSRDRQAAYLRALSTLPEVEIEYGLFQTNKRVMVRADGGGPVEVLRTDEKGSDVNLATRLVADAARRDCDIALVISNDSDLVLAVREARSFGLVVGVAAPVYVRDFKGGKWRYRYPQRELADAGDFVNHITPKRTKLLRSAQFPDVVKDTDGEVRKPATW